MAPKKGHVLSPLATVLVLFSLTACPSGSASNGSDVAVPGSGNAATPVGARRLTLADILGTGSTTEAYARRVKTTEYDRQELIRACMARQGFKYVPYVATGEVVNLTGLPTDLPTDEFRRRYGYGISTGFESALRLAPASPTGGAVNPNDEIVAAMSPAQRAAYLRALRGQAAQNGEPQGCEGEATKAVDKAGAVIQAYGDALRDMNIRIDADRRVVNAERAWRSCLERAGYRFADEAAIEREIQRRMNPLYDAIAGYDVPDGVFILRRSTTLTPEQQAILDSIKSFELAVAKADQDCRGDLDKVRKAVREEYEAEFIEANRDGLRKLLPDSGL